MIFTSPNNDFRPDYDWNNNHEFTAVDSFNLQTMSWQAEESFPFTPIGASTNIPYGNTFITVGGLLREGDYVNKNVDFIYKVRIQKKSINYH